MTDQIPTAAKEIKKQGWPGCETIKKYQPNRQRTSMLEMR